MRGVWQGMAGVAFAVLAATAAAQQTQDHGVAAHQGGGRVSEVSIAAGLLTVDAATLRLDSGAQVYDYAGQRVPASALEVGMSVSYAADPPSQAGGMPVAREVRMVPN
jgi:hypothetical protein